MSSRRKDVFHVENMIGYRLGQINFQMHEQACLAPEYREMLGDLDALKHLMGSDILEFLRPVIIDWGLAAWPRDIVTDLSLKYGDKGQIEHTIKRWPRKGRVFNEQP